MTLLLKARELLNLFPIIYIYIYDILCEVSKFLVFISLRKLTRQTFT